MSIPWVDRCVHCTAGGGLHYEHCQNFYPDYERDKLYRLTKACPTCSMAEARACAYCHHPWGIHRSESSCDLFIACSCEGFKPLPCQFDCRDGRVIPDVVRSSFSWFLDETYIDDLVHDLDKRLHHHYPEFLEDVGHQGHIHIDMKAGGNEEV